MEARLPPALVSTWASTTITGTTGSLLFTLGSVTIFLTVIGSKNLPFAYTIRLFPSLYRLIRPRYSSAIPHPFPPKSQAISTSSCSTKLSAHPRLFQLHTTSSRAYLPEIDINMHKSNSTFFIDADISRAEVLTRLLGQGLANLPVHVAVAGDKNPSQRNNNNDSDDKGGNKNPTSSLGSSTRAPKGGMFLLAGVSAKFLRPIAPLQSYEVSSGILSWEEGQNSTKGALYVVTYFLRPGISKKMMVAASISTGSGSGSGPAAFLRDEKVRRGIYAVLVSRYVFKRGREGIAPETVLLASGLLRRDSEKSGAGDERDTEEWMDGDMVQRTVKSGMEYLAGCML